MRPCVTSVCHPRIRFFIRSRQRQWEKIGSLSFGGCVCVFEPESFAAERVLTQHTNEANALLNSHSANICSGRKHAGCVRRKQAPAHGKRLPARVVNGRIYGGLLLCVRAPWNYHALSSKSFIDLDGCCFRVFEKVLLFELWRKEK